MVTEAAHRQGLKAYLYLAIYEEGWPLELGWHGGFYERLPETFAGLRFLSFAILLLSYFVHLMADRAWQPLSAFSSLRIFRV